MSHVPLVKDVMDASVVTIKPEADIRSAIAILLKHELTGAPVMDDAGAVIGMISEKDCLRVFASAAFYEPGGGLVRDYMSKEVVTVDPDDDVFKAAELFIRHPFRRLPVVAGGRLVGEVSRRHILIASRNIIDTPAVKKPWTDSKYLTPEIKSALDGRKVE